MTKNSLVFIVDDDLSARRGLVRLLLTAGHNVREFASANELLDTLEPGTSGCLILGERMPGLSSETLSAELEARGACLSIIFVTADDNRATLQRARKMGAAALFRKPVDGTALIDAVTWALESEYSVNNRDDI